MSYFCRLTTIDNKTFRGLQSKQIKEGTDAYCVVAATRLLACPLPNPNLIPSLPSFTPMAVLKCP